MLPPHVNFSQSGFTVVGKSIRFGLLAVKNLGRGAIARMVDERRGGGEFTSFYNFCKRMTGRDLNRRAIESLIKCGALDGPVSYTHLHGRTSPVRGPGPVYVRPPH